MPTPASQDRSNGEEDGAGLRTSAHKEHEFGDRGIYDRNDERDNDNDVSVEDLGDGEEREQREDDVQAEQHL